ncbi:alpha/beta hydrolase family protein [Myroides injenensis]|uniref:alpha/beta hydrolase family protein n=1 Tax=Myroides injenensis TaxID=1183151 RepID=UPI0002887832|nr:prolyl oligopeptidase family serine peptidase [Myroides injenensis]
MKKRHLLLGVLFLGVLFLASLSTTVFISCSSDDNKNNTPTICPPSAGYYIGEKEYKLDKLDEAESITIMTYKMPNVTSELADATALVFYPKTPKPADGYRVVVWTHGTVGVGDACAPSNNAIGNNFKVLAKTLLQEGYIIIAPDYEGLGTPGIHPYLHLQSEAYSATYAVKAFKEYYRDNLQGDWMVAGQSQGGQASIGVAEYANEDTNFKGAVAGAPASSLGTIILEVAPTALANIEIQENKINPPIPLDQRNSVNSYATLLSYAALAGAGIKASDPNFDYTILFKERSKQFAPIAEGNNNECLGELRDAFKKDIITFMNENKSHKVMDYPGLDETIFKTNPTVIEFLKISQPGTKKVDKPLLVIQGEADTNVPAVITKGMVDKLKSLGSDKVELILVENASHTEAIVQKNAEVVAFIQKYMPVK